MKTKTSIIILLLVLKSSVFAQGALDNYLQIAARNNPALKAKFNAYQASLEKIPQVGVLPDPSLAFSYFIMPVETKNGPQDFKVSFSQMMPWFGTLKNKEDIFVSAAKSKYEDFEEAKSKLFFEVRSTYYELYFIKKSRDITQENIDILETFKRLALIKIETGKASAVDELRVELELNDLKNTLISLQDKIKVYSVKFNKLINVENDLVIQIPERLWTNDIKGVKSDILTRLQTGNHQIKSLTYIKESFAYKEELAKKQGKPNFLFGVDYTSIGNDGFSPSAGKDAFMIKVGVSIPLYRKKYSAMINEVVFMQETVVNNKENQVNSLEILFEKVFSEYKDANRRLVLFEKQDKLAKRAIRLLEIEYTTNNRNFEEILRMEKSVLKYALEVEKARTDKQTSIAFINYLTGVSQVGLQER